MFFPLKFGIAQTRSPSDLEKLSKCVGEPLPYSDQTKRFPACQLSWDHNCRLDINYKKVGTVKKLRQKRQECMLACLWRSVHGSLTARGGRKRHFIWRLTSYTRWFQNKV